MNNDYLLSAKGLCKYYGVGSDFFGRPKKHVKAVDGVDLAIRAGETLGLVGESGCGKSTLGRALLRLEEPTAGQVFFEGEDLLALSEEELRKKRRHMQVIFQDPFSSLNPRKTVERIIGESFSIHGILPPAEQRGKVMELAELTGLRPEYINRYPHEFSGGQRQRICIARALSLNPRLIIADEPVSALDVSIQAQILNLLVSLQERFNLTYVFISHDLGVVRHMCDRVAVMYLGRIVEQAPARELYRRPRHPYTEALLASVPTANPRRKKIRDVLGGDIPSPIDPPPGCAFHPRCERAGDVCRQNRPVLDGTPGEHQVACHFPLVKTGHETV